MQTVIRRDPDRTTQGGLAIYDASLNIQQVHDALYAHAGDCALDRKLATPIVPGVPLRVATNRVQALPAPPELPECDFQIERPHPLVRNSRTGLRDVRMEYDILLQIGGLGRLNLTVSHAALPRALWIIDRFVKRFLAEGLQLEGKDRTAAVREEYARIKRDEEERLAREMIQRLEARAEVAGERERLEARQSVESLLADVDARHRSQQIRVPFFIPGEIREVLWPH